MTDDDLMALCIWEEAAGEIYEGKVAVGRVIRYRMALHYQSDGTVPGTVEHPSAFSGFNHDFVDGHYVLVAHTPLEIAARAENMRIKAMAQPQVWADCQKAVQDSALGSGFGGGPQFQKLTPRTVLYENPRISSPPWAIPSAFVCSIGHHDFYTDPHLPR